MFRGGLAVYPAATACNRPNAMPAPSPRQQALPLLKDKIARAKARIRRQEMLMELLPPGRVIVAEARLAAAKQRLARLYIERQLLRDELQARTGVAGPPALGGPDGGAAPPPSRT